MTFGENLARLRKSNGISQEKLAEELNLTRQTISKWELNQSTPDIHYILKLSELFEVSTDYLLKGEENDFRQTYVKNELVKDESGYRWCFYLGTVLSAVSLLGMIVFVICSIFKPWEVWIDDKVYTGMTGFLMGTETQGFFAALNIFFLLGMGLAVFGIIKRMYPSIEIWKRVKKWLKEGV